MLWSDDYLIGIETIDEQHKEIFRLLEDLYDKPVDSIYEDLLRYTVDHFDAEHTYMKKTRYPLRWKHQEEHQWFQKQVIRMSVNKATKLELADFIKNWIINHIITVDILLRPLETQRMAINEYRTSSRG